jgi:hypothetical protein
MDAATQIEKGELFDFDAEVRVAGWGVLAAWAIVAAAVPALLAVQHHRLRC